MNRERVLIFGAGHLALRVQTLAEAAGDEVITLPFADATVTENNGLPFASLTQRLRDTEPATLTRAFLLDDEDEHNLQVMLGLMSLDTAVPITVSLFNEHIAPHISAAHPHITVVNLAKMAAPFFVQALDKPLNRSLHYNVEAPANSKTKRSSPSDNLILWMTIAFFCLALLATTYFKYAEGLSWLDAAYFVVVTVATVGYGDINLLNAAWQSKVIGIILILCSTFFIWIIFSLTIDRIIKKREQLSLGRKKYQYKDHIIVCGLGRLGYFIVEELLARGEKVLIIDADEHSSAIETFRRRGVSTYVGNARLLNTLQDTNVSEAKALISVISDDYLNLEIGLNARSFQPNLRLVLRIFDDHVAQNVKTVLDIQLALSMSALIDDIIFNAR